ncbi:MAG: hypothetical protein ACI8P9_002145 [Parasphingorhabdus sp.]
MKTPVIFLHIPKTAGTTLRSVLVSRYSRSSVYTIGNDINRDIESLRDLSEVEKQKILLLQGHMTFGLHEYLAHGARYITVLRDPVERVLSEYRFLKTNQRHPFHSRVVKMSLSDFLTSEFNAQSRNGQTRLLSGSHRSDQPGIPDDGEVSEGHLEIALQNLQSHFVVAGTQEKFEQTLLLCQRKLGWWFYPFYIPRNITARSELSEVIEDRKLIASQNQLDIKLYNAVQERMSKEIVELQPGFDQSLSNFRRHNPRYRFIYMRWLELRSRLFQRLIN